MTLSKPLGVVLIGAFTLSACVDTADPNYQKTRNGAAIGAAIGAVSQIIAGNSTNSVFKGAVVGGVVGAVIGNVLDKQEAELRNDLAGSGATITNTGEELIVTLPEAITFDTDSTYVRPGVEDDLFALASNLRKYPDSTVDVIGHTDDVGDASYNQGLSARRADSVRVILMQDGVEPSRLRAYGRGETEPVASNETAFGRAQNRRVEIVIRPKG